MVFFNWHCRRNDFIEGIDMKFRFTPEMFFRFGETRNIHHAVDDANAALDEHLKGLPRAYGNARQLDVVPAPTAYDTHTALLLDIEELKPKECEHVALNVRGDLKYVCNDCGKVLEYRLVEV